MNTKLLNLYDSGSDLLTICLQFRQPSVLTNRIEVSSILMKMYPLLRIYGVRMAVGEPENVKSLNHLRLYQKICQNLSV